MDLYKQIEAKIYYLKQDGIATLNIATNNNWLFYRRLINATVFYSLTTVLYFLYSTLGIL